MVGIESSEEEIGVDDENEMSEGCEEKEDYEGAVVALTDAVDDEETVMVHCGDAAAAETTVFGADGTDDSGHI